MQQLQHTVIFREYFTVPGSYPSHPNLMQCDKMDFMDDTLTIRSSKQSKTLTWYILNSTPHEWKTKLPKSLVASAPVVLTACKINDVQFAEQTSPDCTSVGISQSLADLDQQNTVTARTVRIQSCCCCSSVMNKQNMMENPLNKLLKCLDSGYVLCKITLP